MFHVIFLNYIGDGEKIAFVILIKCCRYTSHLKEENLLITLTFTTFYWIWERKLIIYDRGSTLFVCVCTKMNWIYLGYLIEISFSEISIKSGFKSSCSVGKNYWGWHSLPVISNSNMEVGIVSKCTTPISFYFHLSATLFISDDLSRLVLYNLCTILKLSTWPFHLFFTCTEGTYRTISIVHRTANYAMQLYV